MATPGVITIKSFSYRGAKEEWSNGYHFVGSHPSDDAGWISLVTSLVGLEATALDSDVQLLRAYCYDDFSPGHDSVLTVTDADFGSTYGALSAVSGSARAPGDSAAWIRWKTARFNTNGKPIYLRKYYHGILITDDGHNADHIEAAQATALGTLATNLNGTSGDWPGIAGPDGVAPGASMVSPFVTTRTLRRRGKRPS